MPQEIYELIAQGARYWFLFLMVLIVWRSFRWYRRDSRQAKKRRKLLPDAGFIGEMIVLRGGKGLERGEALPVPREGTIGFSRTNDLCIPLDGVEKRHLWFRFEDGEGLLVEPYRKYPVQVDGRAFESRRDPLHMAHGSYLVVGECEMRLRLFAGFEATGRAVRQGGVWAEAEAPKEEQTDSQQQAAYQQWAQQQWMMQQYLAQQQAYQQGFQQAMMQMQHAAEEPEEELELGEEADPYTYEEARAQGMVDDRAFMRPREQSKPEWSETESAVTDLAPDVVFYPPQMDDEDEELPKSAYVGHDESERAKQVWDRMFGGGQR